MKRTPYRKTDCSKGRKYRSCLISCKESIKRKRSFTPSIWCQLPATTTFLPSGLPNTRRKNTDRETKITCMESQLKSAVSTNRNMSLPQEKIRWKSKTTTKTKKNSGRSQGIARDQSATTTAVKMTMKMKKIRLLSQLPTNVTKTSNWKWRKITLSQTTKPRLRAIPFPMTWTQSTSVITSIRAQLQWCQSQMSQWTRISSRCRRSDCS